MITIIDLGVGNLRSVANALRRVGAEVSVVGAPSEAKHDGVLVLPGVGAFERAMTRLVESGFDAFVREHVARGLPLVGICLGMQLLGDRSYENGVTAGLGLIRGEVVRLEPHPPDDRVPNIGWRPVTASKPTAMFPPGVDGQSFYHVHSYHLACEDSRDVAATVAFGKARFVTAVEHANIVGMQFHPEKSQDAGLNLLGSLLTHLGVAGVRS